MGNITAEELKNFKEHKVWKEVEQWINGRVLDAGNRSLNAKNWEEVQSIQTEHRTYKAILNKINNLAKEDQ